MIIAFRNRTGVDLYLAKSVDESSIRFKITTSVPHTKNRKEARLVVRMRKGADYGVSGLPDEFRVNIDPINVTLKIVLESDIVPSIDDDGEANGLELFHEYTFRLAQ